MTEQSVMSERTIVIERVFDAPRDLVWKMWTDPDQVARWWGPECFATPRESIEFDLRPGGVRRLTMVGPDGEEYPSDGRFGLVEPPARLSFAEKITHSPMIEPRRRSSSPSSTSAARRSSSPRACSAPTSSSPWPKPDG